MKTLILGLTLAMAGFTLPHQKSNGQDIQEKLTRQRPDCDVIFANAIQLFPEFYRFRQYDSIRMVVNLVEAQCHQNMETYQVKLLLAMQERSFSESRYLDSNAMQLLDNYARNAWSLRNDAGMYGSDRSRFYAFIRMWSDDLLRNPRLAATEQLICRVLGGQVKKASTEVTARKEDFPYLYSLLQKDLVKDRQAPKGIVALTSGVWIPSGSMATLGVHPNLGFQVGGRNRYNQLEFTLQFKFGNTANPYTVIRQGVPYTTNYFFGGYIGLDYSRYFLQSPRFELGAIAGMGYDGFDIAETYYGGYDYLDPTSIGSFNFNTGLRLNYFFTSIFNLGLVGRCNFVDYNNPGGTSLNGQSFTIDLIFSFSYRRHNSGFGY